MYTLIIDGEATSARLPFQGSSGRLLKAIFDQVDPNHGEVKWATLEYDSTGSGHIPETYKTGCSRILLLGSKALAAFNGKKNVDREHGKPMWSDYHNCYVICTPHPAIVLKNPELFRDLCDDITRLLSLPSERVIHPEPRIIVPRNIGEACQAIASVGALAGKSHLAIDIETTGTDQFTDRILAIGLCASPDEVVIIPDRFFTYRKVLEELEFLLVENPPEWHGGHNACQFDAPFIHQALGIPWYPTYDTLFEHYTIDERQVGHGLKDLAARYFYAEDYDLHLNYKAGETMESVSREDLYKYLAWDCIWTYKLHPVLRSEMGREQVTHVHDRILVPGGNAFHDIETVGALVDTKYLQDLSSKLEIEAGEMLSVIQEEASKVGMSKFNPNSPKQVAELLYDKDKLRLPVQKNESGKPGTGVEQLNALKNKHKIVQMILDYRTKSKLKSTYADGLLSKIHPVTGRVHADFLLFGTQTGRLSCQNPNLQNVPMVVGSLVRDAFIAPEGWTLMEADFSQLELKVIAWFSKDPHLEEVFRNQGDIHSMVGEKIFKKPRKDITKPERYKAKLINFGLAYGRSAKSLAAQPEFNSTVKEAEQYIKDFFASFPGLADWIQEQHTRVLETGTCVTAFGRKRRFPLITEGNKASVCRQAQNTPIQGTASDLCLTALIRVHNRVKPEIAKILFTVHDAIMLQVKKGHEREVAELLWEEMTENAPLAANFKFSCDVAIGDRWGSLEHIYPHKCHECEFKWQGDEYDWLWWKNITSCPKCSKDGKFHVDGWLPWAPEDIKYKDV